MSGLYLGFVALSCVEATIVQGPEIRTVVHQAATSEEERHNPEYSLLCNVVTYKHGFH